MLKVKKAELTYDIILEHVTEDQLFQYYVPCRWKVGSLIHSPLRKDSNPSFSIRRNKHGNLTFIDFADDTYRGNACTFVMKLFGLNYNDALEKIDYDLGLGIRAKRIDKIILPKPLPIEISKPKEITIIPRPFSEEDITYWRQYEITVEELKKENIYSVKDYFVNGKLGLKEDKELCFCYYFEGVGKKIYFPERRKGKKWRSSLPNTLLDKGFLDGKKDRVVICKSKKDKMVLQKIVRNVISVQNESSIAFTPEFLKELSEYERIILIYDNDSSGVANSLALQKLYNFELVYMPLEEDVTDPSDYIKKHGQDKLVAYLKQQILK